MYKPGEAGLENWVLRYSWDKLVDTWVIWETGAKVVGVVGINTEKAGWI